MLSVFVCAVCLAVHVTPDRARDCELDHETEADSTDEHGMPDDRLQQPSA